MKNLFGYVLCLFLLGSCLQTNTLFDSYPVVDNSGAMNKLYATQLYADNMSNEIWFSSETGCIDVKRDDEVKHSGESSMKLSWNKLEKPGAWVGLGFGWDDWSGKNLSGLIDSAAIQMYVLPKNPKTKSLPLAMCMEDHSGSQAWTGFSSNMYKKGEGDDWDKVTIPLSAFNWDELETDYTNIKQFIIQFEASGDAHFDDIRIVPFKGSVGKSISVPITKSKIELTEATANCKINDHLLHVRFDGDFLVVDGLIKDKTPLQNSKSGSEIWNGDCIEIAFGTNAGTDKKRKFYVPTDAQIGIKASAESVIYNWKKDRPMKKSTADFWETEDGYGFTAKISFEELGFEALESGKTYGIEIAIDEGNDVSRDIQSRWNNPETEGFNSNPSLWGQMIIK